MSQDRDNIKEAHQYPKIAYQNFQVFTDQKITIKNVKTARENVLFSSQKFNRNDPTFQSIWIIGTNNLTHDLCVEHVDHIIKITSENTC